MKVVNKSQPFSKDWDTLLNTILDTHITYEVHPHVIDFTVTVGEDKPWWHFGFTRTITTTFSVWISSKDFCYGYLTRRDGETVPIKLQYAPSQETLDRLYDFEINNSTPRKEKFYIL